MHDHLNDEEAERILTGKAPTEPLGATLDSIRNHFASIPPAEPDEALKRFVSVDLTSPTPTPHKERKMSSLASFAGTVVGKVLIGASVAAASVGGAHATGAIDVPVLPEVGSSAVVATASVDDTPTPADSSVTPVADDSSSAASSDDDSPSSTSSTTSSTSTTSTTVVANPLIVVSPRTFTALDAGSVTIQGDSAAGLVVVSTAPAEGWSAEIETDEIGEAGVNFRRGDERVDFRAEIEDGQLRIRVRDRRTDTSEERFYAEDGTETAKRSSSSDDDSDTDRSGSNSGSDSDGSGESNSGKGNSGSDSSDDTSGSDKSGSGSGSNDDSSGSGRSGSADDPDSTDNSGGSGNSGSGNSGSGNSGSGNSGSGNSGSDDN